MPKSVPEVAEQQLSGRDRAGAAVGRGGPCAPCPPLLGSGRQGRKRGEESEALAVCADLKGAPKHSGMEVHDILTKCLRKSKASQQ